MRVSRRRGVVRIALDEVEIGLLRSLFEDLADALRVMPPDDPVRVRLFPAGYRDDAEAAEEYRDLTEASLLADRLQRIERVTADLPAAAGLVTLDVEASARWLAVVNDLRLAIGTRLGVQADDVPYDVVPAGRDDPGSDDAVDPDDEDERDEAADRAARAVYVWLTSLLDRLVEAVTS